jgi:general secretion pathway protein K
MTGQVARRQAGAAILAAMLTVTLVAALAAAALWQQWREVEVETAERSRMQSSWVLIGALDWARLILREDARQSGADHLSEPWAVPLMEARLSTFLAVDRNNTQAADASQETFLSGDIVDLQSRLNVTNLIQAGKVDAPSLLAFSRLFKVLNLPQDALDQMVERLRLAQDTNATDQAVVNTPLVPQELDQLAWVGLTPLIIERLRPFVTVLPVPTPVNLNTAPAEVIYSAVNDFELTDAQRLVRARDLQHLTSLADAKKVSGVAGAALTDAQHSVSTRFFEVHGSLRTDQTTVQEISVVQRDGMVVRTLSRRRGVYSQLTAPQ